jgi:hypothetical protein
MPHGESISALAEFPTSSITRPSTCVDRLLLHLSQILDESLKREKRPTPQKGALVDEIKMDQLLQRLHVRTNKFVGTIDPKHLSYHLSGEHKLMPRRSFAHISVNRETSSFKAALKKFKSTSAVAVHRGYTSNPL